MLGQSPMRGGAFAIEQAGGCDQAHARAHTGDGSSALVPAPQPGHNRRIALDHVVQAEAGGRNEDQVRLADVFERRRRLDMDWPITTDSPSIRRCGGHAKTRSRALSRKQVPQRPGVAEDFHRTDCGGGKRFVEKQDGDICHGDPLNKLSMA